MKLRYIVPTVLLAMLFAVFLLAKYHKPMHLRPVNQQFASEVRQLQAGDLMVDNVGETCAVVRQLDKDYIELRDVRDTRFETEIYRLAMEPQPRRLIRQGTAEYPGCAAAYIKKVRCRPN